jgi:hypothetical protein
MICWRHSNTTHETLREKVLLSLFARANTGISAGADPSMDAMNTENVSEMKKEAEERALHRMAKVQDFWRCGKTAKTHVLHRRNLELKISRSPARDTVRTAKRSSKHPGHSFNIIAWLH